MAALTLAIIGTAAALAATGYQISESRDARRESKDATRDAQTAQRGLEEEARRKKEQEDLAVAGKAADARRRLTLIQGGKSDKGGTVKTTALGSTADQGNYARKVATGL